VNARGTGAMAGMPAAFDTDNNQSEARSNRFDTREEHIGAGGRT